MRSKAVKFIVSMAVIILILIGLTSIIKQPVFAEERVYYQIELGDTTLYQNKYGVSNGTSEYYGKDYYEIPRVFIENNNGRTYLNLNQDFIFTYYKDKEAVTSIVDVGLYELVIEGMGEYADKGVLRTVTVEILPPRNANIEKLPVFYEGDTSTYRYIKYDGLPHDGLPIIYANWDEEETSEYLKNGIDYTYAYYKDGVEVKEVKEEGSYQLIVSGKGYYSGSKIIDIEIGKISIKDYRINIWGGLQNNKEKVKIQYGQSDLNKYIPTFYEKNLVCGEDYEYSYYQNGKIVNFKAEPGEYILKITGIGNYKGEITLYLTIKKYSLSKFDIIMNKSSFKYDKKGHAPTVKVTSAISESGDKYIVLKKGKDYTISDIKLKKDIGIYTIVIKGKGNYQGTVKVNWMITPKDTSFTMSTGNNEIYVTPKSSGDITGYQIEYGTKTSWTYDNTKTTIMNKGIKTKVLPTNYANNVKVYVRVRAYKNVNGKNVYGAWSKKKLITVKGPVKVYYY